MVTLHSLLVILAICSWVAVITSVSVQPPQRYLSPLSFLAIGLILFALSTLV